MEKYFHKQKRTACKETKILQLRLHKVNLIIRKFRSEIKFSINRLASTFNNTFAVYQRIVGVPADSRPCSRRKLTLLIWIYKVSASILHLRNVMLVNNVINVGQVFHLYTISSRSFMIAIYADLIDIQ